ncbi:MAG: tetratricopeptide repeat protein, partial [Planctomycetota bacterium JB042]
GLGAVGKGDLDRAERLLAEAPPVAANRDDVRALERLRAAILAARGREGEAARLRADLGAPRGALEAFSLGCVLDQTDAGTAEATAAFESAVLLADRPSQIFHLSYLRALFLEKRFEDAARVGAVVERRWPESPTALFWVAMAAQMEDPVRAVALLERAVERKPDHVDAWMILAQCLERTGAPAEATAAYETAVRLAEEAGRDDLWRHHLVRGATLFVQGRLDEALPPLELASSQQPTSAMVHHYLGRVLIQLGRNEEGIAALKQALEHADDEERPAIEADLGGKEGEEGEEGERDEGRPDA